VMGSLTLFLGIGGSGFEDWVLLRGEAAWSAIEIPPCGGILDCLIFGQGFGVTPDSGKTVLRSRLGQNYGNCRPASGPREATGCRNRLLTGSDALRNRI
jgi:hypothetical protein